MATKISIQGKTISRPGVYSQIKSGISNPPLTLSYGNICIVDSGIGAGFGGGSGVAGALKTGVDSLYSFDTPQDYQNFVKGGPLWDLAKPLFKPAGVLNGVSRIFFIRAATTTQATLAMTFTYGSITFKTKDEGLNANGVVDGLSELQKGYAIKFVAGIINANKFRFQFYHGTAKDVVGNTDAGAELLFQSPEVSSIDEFLDWAENSADFNGGFVVSANTITTTTSTSSTTTTTSMSGLNSGPFTPADLTTNAGYKLFAGGTETYSASTMTAALQATQNADCTFYLATEFGDNATSANNVKIFDYITENSLKYQKFMIVGGGLDANKFSGMTIGTSEYTSRFYNSDRVLVVHGGVKTASRSSSTGFLNKDSLYHAANILGRTCGLEPQTPLTLKNIDIAGVLHPLSDPEIEYALEKGITYTTYDYELAYFAIGQGVMTLQPPNNEFLVNDDGSSFDLSIKRITSQLNKEIGYNFKRTFFGKNVGPNRNTVSPEDTKAWLIGFLSTKQATSENDNLILRYLPDSIVVTASGDVLNVEYAFVVNGPISKAVLTGTILEG